MNQETRSLGTFRRDRPQSDGFNVTPDPAPFTNREGDDMGVERRQRRWRRIIPGVGAAIAVLGLRLW